MKNPSVLELDEYTEELLDVFGSISGTRLDPELLNVSRQVELDFVSQLGVSRKRPRTWATDRGFPVISTKWVDVNKGNAKQPECRSRLCRKELKRWAPTIPGTFASMGPLECVILLFSKALMWKPGASGPSARKITFLGASRAHCQADATSEMAIELPPEEQAKGQDFVGELLNSLHGTRKAAHSWERKWQSGIVEMNFEIGTWSPAIVCCCEREVCGFVHGDDIIFVGESMQLAWTESGVDEKPLLKKKAVLGPDDGDDKTVTIFNLLVTWVCLSESRNQIEIEADPRHREILLAQMKLDGANTQSVATPAVKVQESKDAYKTRQRQSVVVQKCNNESKLHVYQPLWMYNKRRRRLHDLCHSQTNDLGTCSND